MANGTIRARGPAGRTATPAYLVGSRLSAAKQRRLDALLRRGGAGELSVKERRELGGLLEYIDRRSFWMLARGVLDQLAAERQPRRKTAAG